MSHTPGPWKWDEGQGVITAEWNGFPWHIATVDMSELGWHENEQCKSRENGDNARLIASAPDLLAVCQAYDEWEGDIIINGDWGPAGMHPYPRLTEAQYDRMLELQAMRNAAIRKAKGGSDANE